MAEDLVRNRKALHDYHVIDTWEAGIALLGTEVKSLREGRGQLQDAYVDEAKGELWLRQAHIAPYTHGTHANHEPLRARKLLLHREEIRKIVGKVERKGFTLIPLALYLDARGRVKVRLALCQGKQAHDKRDAIREREEKRELDRARKGEG